jgi:hypothetical protein
MDTAFYVVMISGSGNFASTLLKKSKTPALIWEFILEPYIKYIDPYFADVEETEVLLNYKWVKGNPNRSEVIKWFRDRMWDINETSETWPANESYTQADPTADIMGLRTYFIT